MQKAFLIYNPASGRRRAKRALHISHIVDVLRKAGVQVEACATTHAGSATQQAHEAVVAGFDTVVACGGDGTANEVLNGLMQTSADVALGLCRWAAEICWLQTSVCLLIRSRPPASCLII